MNNIMNYKKVFVYCLLLLLISWPLYVNAQTTGSSEDQLLFRSFSGNDPFAIDYSFKFSSDLFIQSNAAKTSILLPSDLPGTMKEIFNVSSFAEIKEPMPQSVHQWVQLLEQHGFINEHMLLEYNPPTMVELAGKTFLKLALTAYAQREYYNFDTNTVLYTLVNDVPVQISYNSVNPNAQKIIFTFAFEPKLADPSVIKESYNSSWYACPPAGYLHSYDTKTSILFAKNGQSCPTLQAQKTIERNIKARGIYFTFIDNALYWIIFLACIAISFAVLRFLRKRKNKGLWVTFASWLPISIVLTIVEYFTVLALLQVIFNVPSYKQSEFLPNALAVGIIPALLLVFMIKTIRKSKGETSTPAYLSGIFIAALIISVIISFASILVLLYTFGPIGPIG